LGHKYPMTGFFERIAIQLDAQQYPGPEGRIAWDKAQHRCGAVCSVCMCVQDAMCVPDAPCPRGSLSCTRVV
jgi:hypothetical protein